MRCCLPSLHNFFSCLSLCCSIRNLSAQIVSLLSCAHCFAFYFCVFCILLTKQCFFFFSILSSAAQYRMLSAHIVLLCTFSLLPFACYYIALSSSCLQISASFACSYTLSLYTEFSLRTHCFAIVCFACSLLYMSCCLPSLFLSAHFVSPSCAHCFA